MSSENDFDIIDTTIADVHAAYQDGRLTARQLVQQYLDRIKAYDQDGPKINSIISLNPQALEDADRLDKALADGNMVGPLHGIPLLMKDQADVDGMPTTMGSVLFKDHNPGRDCTIAAKLKAAGTADFNQALRRGAMKHRTPGVSVVLSDFLDPAGYEEGLKSLAHRGSEIHAVQILSPEELEPSAYGDLKVIDSETGAEQEVTFGKYRLKAYRATVQNYCQRLQEFCRARGVRYQLARSDTPIDDLLLKAMRTGGMWR